MQILNLRPGPPRGPGPAQTVAFFDAQVTEDIRLRFLSLRRNADGRYSVFAPNLRGQNVASFSPSFAARIAAAAVAALNHREGMSPNDFRTAA